MCDRPSAQDLADLRDPDAAKRVAAARRLGEAASSQVVEPLIAALGDSSDAVRSAVRDAVDAATPAVLRELLASDSVAGMARTVLKSTLALVESGGPPPADPFMAATWSTTADLSPACALLLVHSRPEVRRTGASLSAKSPAPSIPSRLELALDDPAAAVREAAATSLGALGSTSSTDRLARALGDSEASVQRAATRALSRLGGESGAQALALRLLGDGSPQGHTESMDALVRLGSPGADALRDGYARADAAGRRRAIAVAARLEGEAAIDLFRLGMKDESAEVREATASVLAKGSPAAAVPLAAEALLDDETSVRLAAVEALSRLAAGDELRRALTNDRAVVRARVAQALGRLGRSDDGTIAALIDATGDESPIVRRAATIAVAALGDPSGVARLIERLKEGADDPSTTEGDFRALFSALVDRRVSDALVDEVLRGVTQHPNVAYRLAAAETLARRADRTHFPILAELLYDEDERTRSSASEGLLELKGMRQHLKKYSKDTSYVPPPRPEGEQVHYSLVAPATLAPGQATVVTVWAHFLQDADEVVRLARGQYGSREIVVASKSGSDLAYGAELTVRLSVTGLVVDDPEDSFVWRGSIANAGFPVSVPKDACAGTYPGSATVRHGDVRVAKLHFVLEVGERPAPPAPIPTKLEQVRRAFASYSSEDRPEALARIQGMQKAFPGLDVFLDVASLRSGEKWALRLDQEIAARDVFYLFWSPAASRSEWVEREWRRALELKGIDYIDPVPLASPLEAPPPKELADLHFNDWTLAFLRAGR